MRRLRSFSVSTRRAPVGRQRTSARFAACLTIAILAGTAGCGGSGPHRRQYDAEVHAGEIAGQPAGWLSLPARARSIKFAVIGDSGRGTPPQHEVAAQMLAYRERFPFTFVVMLGDNIYEGPATARDYELKFEGPYRALLDAGVKFYAVLGNHDDPRQRFYPSFNMTGQPYYTFEPEIDLLTRVTTTVRFFGLDTTSIDGTQRAWLDRELQDSKARWNICLMHNPLYTSGRYEQYGRYFRWQFESTFVQRGVDVALSGHEHIYQRSRLQQGILYFISGGAGSLRRGDARPSEYIARSFDDDYHFMLMEIDGDELHFQAIARSGLTVDAGVLKRTRIDR